MKKAILNVVTYSMLGWGVISAIYLGLPPEVKELLPEMNWVTAVVSGGSTTLIGSASLMFRSMLAKSNTATNEVYASIAKLVLDNNKKYDEIVASNLQVVQSNIELKASTDRNNLLLETVLKTKLSNPLIDEFTKKVIEGVLNEEENAI